MTEREPPVLAASSWNTNADLILECVRLGYLRADLPTLDATYGKGIWWQKWRPDELVTNDIDKERSDADHNEDFRQMSFASGIFPQIAYDPPYAATGGKKTSTVPDMINRFGRDLAPMSAQGTQDLINDGLTEMYRLATPRKRGAGQHPGGIVLVKMMPYVWSGALWEGDVLTRNHAVELGFEVLTKFIHVGSPGPQDPNRTKKCPTCSTRGAKLDPDPGCDTCDGVGRIASTQASPYNNYSVLYVFRKR